MPRGLLIFALCLPLAVLLGFMLADPLMGSNMMVISGCLFALLIPIALTVHHRAVVWTSAAAITAFFLPGQPPIWMVIAAMSFLISTLSWPLTKAKMKPVWDKAVFLSLLFLTASILLTALRSGGIGMRVLGSSVYGGRKYVALLGSVVGFLALTLHVLPRRTAQRDLSMFVLGPVTSAFSNIAYMLGPSFYFLFLLFPVDMALGQAQADLSPALIEIKRISGFGPASTAVCMYRLLRWGLKGICEIKRPWRFVLFITAILFGLLSGFRSSILILATVLGVQFFAEGLHRTRYLAVFGGLAVAAALFLASFSESLPLSAQRAISFLPVKVNPIAATDAKASLLWRFEMWREVIKQVPDHLWFGKGYAIDPTDLFLADESFRRGFVRDYEISMMAGDYHNGPLSIIVPFGITGILAVMCFFVSAVQVLRNNVRYGDSELKRANTFLFSYFFGRLLFFLFFFGSIESDLWVFVSTVAVSLSLNGGVHRPLKIRRAPKTNAMVKQQRDGDLATV